MAVPSQILITQAPVHTLQEVDLFARLDADTNSGLSQKEAAERLAAYGRNAISREESEPAWLIFLKQFKSPIVLLLVVAAGLSFAFQEWLDGIAILVVIFINAVIGFYMEYQAERSMEALKKLTSIPGKVLREGKLVEIDSEEIVPGDVIYLEAGDMVVADARFYNGFQLQVDESALTGESVPVDKMPGSLPEGTPLAERTNSLYKGTFATKGNGWAVVAATGMQTELGKIARLVQSSTQAATPLEKKLEEFSKRLIKITVGLVALIFAVGALEGRELVKMLETSIALAVAAIPEGLPIVATLALAQGMLKMARHKVIVRKLSAVETLGGTTVICTDKTGTLTQNKMEVVALNTPGGKWNAVLDEVKPPQNCLEPEHYRLMQRIGILCSTAEVAVSEGEFKEIGDPLETGLLKFAIRQGEDVYGCRLDFPKTEETPFTSETKIMATLHRLPEGGAMVFAKGATEELLDRCTRLLGAEKEIPLTPEARKTWLAEAEKMAASGLRVIAGAYKSAENGELAQDLVFAGLFGMMDPPREDIPDAIRQCRDAGIQVVMVTGDHPATAKAIGGQLGLLDEEENGVILGKEMKDYEHLTSEDKQRWADTKIFARVSPQQKLDLVKVFQERRAVVGMTGDGVNDAPALKKADIGIAMGQRGTQVAQEVADMVLKDDSFASIVVAIREGRVIFDNIRKFVIFLLSCNLSELAVIATVSLLFLHFQLQPLQILFINLVTDVLPALALGVTAGSPAVMQHKPRSTAEPIIDRQRWRRIFFYSLVIAAATIGAVYFSHYVIHTEDVVFDPERCTNILFFTLIFSQLFHVFNMGSIDAPFFKTEVARNRYVWLAVGICFLIVVGLYEIEVVRTALSVVPMSAADWATSVGAGLVAMVVIRIGKHLQFFRNEKS